MVKVIKKKKKEKTNLDDVLTVISKWSQDNNVYFIGEFVSFDDDGEVLDGRTIAYGPKEAIKMSLTQIVIDIHKDKEEIINW